MKGNIESDLTAELTKEIEESSVEIEYYTLDGKHPKIYMCPGDLQVICNVMHDYAALLEEIAPTLDGLSKATYEIHAGRCRKIQKKFEDAIGYDVEKALERCRKKRSKKEDDIGEDALILAARGRKEKKESGSEQEKKVKKDNGQMSLFDIVKE